ncbi:MAG: mechanosensitive ion channel [Clostridia bacterium]|nr:mechanosensitive ion channel [Clostridia bacterium]
MTDLINKIFGDKALNGAVSTVASFAIKLFIGLFILFVGFKIVNILLKKLKKSKLFERTDDSVKSFLISFLSIAFKAIVLITVAAFLGVPMTSMVALVASAGVAIGLALQGGLSNIAGGIMIIIFRPFSVGNYIECGGFSGTVTSIGIFHTSLATPDNKKIFIPNSILTTETLINYSAEKTRRADMEFSAAYNCDIEKVKGIILDTARAIPEAMKMNDEKPMEVLVVSYDPSGIRYRVRIWCAAEDYWTITFAMNENVKKAFDREGIEIPYNKVDVNIIQK